MDKSPPPAYSDKPPPSYATSANPQGYPQPQGYPPAQGPPLGPSQGQMYPPGQMPPQGQPYPAGPPQGQQYPAGPPQGQSYPAGPPQGQPYPAAPPQTTYIAQPAPVLTTHAITVGVGGNCSHCGVGYIAEGYTTCGIVLAILCFPLGILCCLAMKEQRCTHCRRVY